MIPCGGGTESGARTPKHKWRWLEMDGAESEEEAEAAAEAEMAAEAEAEAGSGVERRFSTRLQEPAEGPAEAPASWLPRPGSLRAAIMSALRAGSSEREDIYAHVTTLPEVQRDTQTTSLRDALVTAFQQLERGLSLGPLPHGSAQPTCGTGPAVSAKMAA